MGQVPPLEPQFSSGDILPPFKDKITTKDIIIIKIRKANTEITMILFLFLLFSFASFSSSTFGLFLFSSNIIYFSSTIVTSLERASLGDKSAPLTPIFKDKDKARVTIII